jgi:hypothetical protein
LQLKKLHNVFMANSDIESNKQYLHNARGRTETIVRMEHRMIASLLRLWLRSIERFAEANCVAAAYVDRMELNHYWWATGCESHQVIIWRWSEQQAQFQAQRFFFITGDDDDLPYQVNGRWRFTYRSKPYGKVQAFETVDFIETVTAHDPWQRARAS